MKDENEDKKIYNNPNNVWTITNCKCPEDKSYLCVDHLQARDNRCHCRKHIGYQCGGCEKLDPLWIEKNEKEILERNRIKLLQKNCIHKFQLKKKYTVASCIYCDIFEQDSIMCSVTKESCIWRGDNKDGYNCQDCNRKLG